jgi:hypothetical protein
VGIGIKVPDVRDIVSLEVFMHALADADQPVFVSAENPEQLDFLFCGLRIWDEFRRRFRIFI